MKIIGLDVGEKRIGIAKADSSTRIAVPVGFIETNGLEWQEIAQVAKLNNTNLFVVGLPRSNEGTETQQSLYARNFAKQLMGVIPGARVRFQDESLTSVMAEERLKSRQKKYAKGEIDAEAAAIILQDFLESLSPAVSSTVSTTDTLKGARPSLRSAEETIERPQQQITKLAKREADRAKLNAKKAKHKMGGVATAIVILLVAGLIAGGVTFGVFWFKEQRAKEREEYYKQLEAEMEARTFNFTIRPGETIFDVKKNLLAIDRNGGQTEGDLLPKYTLEEVDAAFNKIYDFDFLQGRPEGATLEGYLYPETYNFYGEVTVEEILQKFLEKMGEIVRENGLVAKYSEHGLSLFQGVTLASIVQKEAASPEQPTVAQVFLSRLANGMALGSDVTVSYALDEVDPDRNTYSDNQAALSVDSCYNTRANRGLPCGPISNPGLSALLAVADPSDTAYLYFLTGDDGLMYYSYTESEHIQNIHSHCQELCDVAL